MYDKVWNNYELQQGETVRQNQRWERQIHVNGNESRVRQTDRHGEIESNGEMDKRVQPKIKIIQRLQ